MFSCKDSRVPNGVLRSCDGAFFSQFPQADDKLNEVISARAFRLKDATIDGAYQGLVEIAEQGQIDVDARVSLCESYEVLKEGFDPTYGELLK